MDDRTHAAGAPAMSRTAAPTRRPHGKRAAHRMVAAAHSSDAAARTYGGPFWLALTSSLLVAVSIALLYRYADFVTFLGGTEFHLGWITGIGMTGSLFVRLALGSWVDRYGTRVVWLISTVLMAASCAAHLAVSTHTGPAVYVLRILYCSALAGYMGASMTFVSKQAPPERMAEMVGLLGAAGFLGAILGTALGDLSAGSVTAGAGQIRAMFLLAAAANLLACPCIWLATRKEPRPDYTPGPSLLHIVRRHHPGPALVMAAAMGLAIGLPAVFLRTYATDLKIPRLGTFFIVYSITALLVRLYSRRWPERFGNRPIILLGASIMAASMWMFLPVHREWQLIVPAVGFGSFHAILFPALMAQGSLKFPLCYRGVATALVLAMFDFGQLIGSPATGALLHGSAMAGLPPYPTMFLTMGVVLGGVGLWYAAVTRPGVDPAAAAAAERDA